MTDDIEIPDQNLDFVDTLDLDDMTQRRAATRVIVDFYGSVLSEIGARYLNFSPTDLTQGVGPLWRKARGRFKSVRDVDIPSGYDSLLNRLHNEQNEVDHDSKITLKKSCCWRLAGRGQSGQIG